MICLKSHWTTIGEELEVVEAHLPSLFKKVAQIKKSERETFLVAVRYAMGLLACRHCGLKTSMNAIFCIKETLGVVDKYYQGTWAKDEDDRNNVYPPLNTKHESSIKWFDMFHRAFLFSLLAKSATSVELVSNWLEYWLEAEPHTQNEDVIVGKVYKIMGSFFRKHPLEKIDLVETEILKGSNTRAINLLIAWNSIVKRNQASFDEAIVKALFAHGDRIGDVRLRERVTLHWVLDIMIAYPESTIIAAASYLNMKLPAIPDELACYVVTADSIGLELDCN